MKPLAQNSLIQNRYLIVHLIGKGGMGEVYLSVDQRLGSAVALKRTFFAGDENLRAAFEREAKILARVRHPVLPKVSDHFGEGEEQYLVMEHISGDDLSKRLEIAQKPFPISWVMFWADQLLDALSYLHAHEPPIIHRDIKPQNLKLTDENHIILLDFGLSKNTGNVTNADNSSGSTAGSIVGYTPHYAPMEQIRGIGTSPRSDLYSLSATLYQLMTNEVPADALSRADCLLNGMEDPLVPPYQLNQEISKEVSDVIMKGMEISQDKRYADAREMQKVLRKAFNKMQTSMSADTIAFNANDIAGSNAGSDLFNSTPKKDDSIKETDLNKSLGGTYNTNFTQKEEPAPDLNQTVRYDPGPSGEQDGVRQADVKTEVFLAGSTPFVVPDEIPATPESPQSFVEEPSSAPAQTDYYSADEMGSAMDGQPAESVPENASFSPDATVPLINLGSEANGSTDPYASQTDYGQAVDDDENGAEAKAAPVAVAAVPAKANKKSSGKTLAVVGALFLLLLLVGGAIGAGIYAYVNYPEMFGIAEETPSPTEEFTPTPTPTPEPSPTEDLSLINNSNTDNSNLDNSNSDNSNIITVEPTPVPEDTTRPQTQKTPIIRRTPNPRPPKTPVQTRPTPKVGPTIYQ